MENFFYINSDYLNANGYYRVNEYPENELIEYYQHPVKNGIKLFKDKSITGGYAWSIEHNGEVVATELMTVSQLNECFERIIKE